MGPSFLLNGLGLMIGASLAGVLMAKGHGAYGAVGAVALFGLAMGLPLFREYNALRRGFRGVEKTIQNKNSPPEPVEIFLPHLDNQVSWRARPSPKQFYGALSMLAIILLVADLIALMSG